LFQGLSTACLNFPEHFVVSGPRERIAVLAEILKKRHVASLVLPISHAFHSNLLDPVEPDIKNIFTALPLRQPEKPVISSCLARAAAVEDLNPQHGWEVLRKPVRFQETVLFMEKEGPWTYIDAGPSGTLASFIRNIAEPAGSSSRAFPILTPFGKDLRGLEKLKQALGL
jgi:acyl transferase domain-containing protein